MSSSTYDVDLIVYTNEISDGRGIIDLNLLSLDGFFGRDADVKHSPSSISKRYIDSVKEKFSTSLYENAKMVSKFLLTYRNAGRRTIFNGLVNFFDFQVDKALCLRDPSCLPDYCVFLQSKIYTREFGKIHCESQLSSINKFLMYTGDISSQFKFSFQVRNRLHSNGTYTATELKSIISVTFKLYQDSSKMLEEHFERSKQGFRNIPLSQVSSINIASFKEPDITFDYVLRNPVYWFMQCSYILLCFYTWSNEKQLVELDTSEFNFDEEGIESKWLFKARASKFVRLSIGVSGLEGDKTGMEFYRNFLSVRKELYLYLNKKGYSYNLGEPLLFSINAKSYEIRRLKPYFSSFKTHSLFIEAISLGFKIPNISTRRIRRTVEQFADNELKNPTLTLNKAQHSWDTYRKSYASGNPIEARQKISQALKQLTEAAVSEKNIKTRQEMASDYNINLLDKNSIGYQINGFGCLDLEGDSKTSKAFIRKQEKSGRTPKLCADLSNCVNCSHCAVIEDENAIYQLLSFQYMVEFNKSVYIGSKNASEKYRYLVERIDLMLAFIDPIILARARSRLQSEGVAEEWKN
ncbi:hypothetical protein [Shewanella donghaensis]|uniref:hypothetical protein n=1 Tax=Shewanella donghaensis TaxID=238836 RepID=UPI001182646D|nr:hypothetical protein [Shewanella donghaensis]